MVIVRAAVIASLLLACSACPARGEDADPAAASDLEAASEGPGIGHRLLWYLPNRLLDLLDIFRLRVRVGPGAACGVRATKALQLFLGSYIAIYAGLPGPRMSALPRSPIGLESHNGIDLSLLEASVSGGMSPAYSPTEFGAGAQLGVAGIDVGFDPVELADFVVGLAAFDLRDDDL